MTDPRVQAAWDNPHPLVAKVLPVIAAGGARVHEEEWRHNTAVLSIVFDWLDQGLAPFPQDIADALNHAGITSARGCEWKADRLGHLLQSRWLWRDLCGYRHEGNLAFVRRVNQRGKSAVKTYHRA